MTKRVATRAAVARADALVASLGMWLRVDGLRTFEMGTPGEMRQRLNDLILTGRKRATAGLLAYDYEAESEEVERVGERLALLDNGRRKIAELEVTRVDVVPFREVTWEFADAEGEGARSVEHWREGHLRYWTARGYEVGDDTAVVCLWIRLL
jgi:uncharacterized protein YhfF